MAAMKLNANHQFIIGIDLVFGSTYKQFNEICLQPQGTKRQYALTTKRFPMKPTYTQLNSLSSPLVPLQLTLASSL